MFLNNYKRYRKSIFFINKRYSISVKGDLNHLCSIAYIRQLFKLPAINKPSRKINAKLFKELIDVMILSGFINICTFIKKY